MIELHRDGEQAELRIQHPKDHNPFTRSMTRELCALCRELEADDGVKAVLLWGGPGRSFSVGGDFADIRELGTAEEGKEYLRDIVRSYQAVLAVSKPLVAAVDRHAIGQGLQVALMADWRVGTERSRYQMPELAIGMPCPLGSTILEALLGRAAMLRLVIGCGELDGPEALDEGLIDELCPQAELEAVARARLARLLRYPPVAYRLTKRIHNERLSRRLEEVCEAAASAHAESYASGAVQAHFAAIVGAGGANR
jgi:enoyl-CoA hydratase/carnithine racemase